MAAKPPRHHSHERHYAARDFPKVAQIQFGREKTKITHDLLFTSLYISLHLFTSLYISLHLATKTDMQNVRKMLIQNLARVIHLKQNKTELVRSFKSDDIEPKKSKESIKTESCHCCFLSATQSWRLARVGKLDDQRLPFLTLLSGTSLYCVLII